MPQGKHAQSGMDQRQYRDDQQTQDFGATLVLVFGTPAAVAVAHAIGNWLVRSRGTITIVRGDTKIITSNLSGAAQLQMVDKLKEFFAKE